MSYNNYGGQGFQQFPQQQFGGFNQKGGGKSGQSQGSLWQSKVNIWSVADQRPCKFSDAHIDAEDLVPTQISGENDEFAIIGKDKEYVGLNSACRAGDLTACFMISAGQDEDTSLHRGKIIEELLPLNLPAQHFQSCVKAVMRQHQRYHYTPVGAVRFLQARKRQIKEKLEARLRERVSILESSGRLPSSMQGLDKFEFQERVHLKTRREAQQPFETRRRRPAFGSAAPAADVQDDQDAMVDAPDVVHEDQYQDQEVVQDGGPRVPDEIPLTDEGEPDSDWENAEEPEPLASAPPLPVQRQPPLSAQSVGELLTAQPKRRARQPLLGYDFEAAKDVRVQSENGNTGVIIGGEIHQEHGARLLVKNDLSDVIETMPLQQFQESALRAGADVDFISELMHRWQTPVTPARPALKAFKNAR